MPPTAPVQAASAGSVAELADVPDEPDPVEQMKRWKDAALAQVKAGQAATVGAPFDDELQAASSGRMVRDVFEHHWPKAAKSAAPVDDVRLRAIIALEQYTARQAEAKAAPQYQQQPITIYNQLPANAPTPIVNDVVVNVPEQKAAVIPPFPTPTVNVTNQVNPTPVTIKNAVDVNVPQVAQQTTKVTRNQGEITGSVTSFEYRQE